MKHARTRVAVGKTDFERDLLRSWKSEAPSEDARHKALALFGGGAGVGGAVASTAKAAKITAVTASLPPKAATLGIGAAGKWILASVILTSAVGASVVRSRSAHNAPPPIATTVQTSAVAVPSAAPMAPHVDLPIVPVPAEVASSSAAPKIAAHEKSISAAPDTTPDTNVDTTSDHERSSLALGEEVAAIDRARAASAAGDYAGALAALDAYDARFPEGDLAQESAALRVETLFQAGDATDAAPLAEHFLAVNPSSPHAARIRALLHP